MLHARNFSALRLISSKNFEERARAVELSGRASATACQSIGLRVVVGAHL